jgi:acetamidase/formamidase
MKIVLFAFNTLFCVSVFAQPLPRKLLFTPSVYYREFSVKHQPVLYMEAGDTVMTESVDAGGVDKTGNRITGRGNPLTGPFYIENAQPGDIIAVTIISVSLNRNYATTLNALIPKMDEKRTGRKNWRSARLVKWMLDTLTLTGTADPRYDKLKNIRLKLHPFLGCIGVAPEGEKGMSSGASGYFGGNIDSRFAREGTTVYLPVYHPGALLFLGDGHAAQGDGELNGDALETSMRFSFTTKLITKGTTNMPVPLLEDSAYYMVPGIENSLERSMKVATMKIADWLKKDFNLSTEEISQLIGPAIEYRIPKVAAGKVEVIAMLPKSVLGRD